MKNQVLPFITVVIPTLNEELHIENCLQALSKQSYPQECYEVIVVDNGSKDQTVIKVQEYDVRLLFEEQRSAYRARNRAILNSNSDYLAFIDADCIAEPKWLENFVDHIEKSQSLIAGGMIIYDIVEDTYANRLLVERNSPERRRTLVCQSHSVAGGNMLVKRTTFEQYGLFKPAAYSSDIEFSKRLAEASVYPVFAENAIVHHQCDLSNWEYLWRSYETKKSQILHSSQNKTWGSLAKAIYEIPWQPGLSFLWQTTLSNKERMGKIPVAEWLYRWIERWFAYAGRIKGYWVAVNGQIEQLNQYSSSLASQTNNDN